MDRIRNTGISDRSISNFYNQFPGHPGTPKVNPPRRRRRSRATRRRKRTVSLPKTSTRCASVGASSARMYSQTTTSGTDTNIENCKTYNSFFRFVIKKKKLAFNLYQLFEFPPHFISRLRFSAVFIISFPAYFEFSRLIFVCV